MGDFNFSTFLASITPGGGGPEDIDEPHTQPQTPNGDDPELKRRLCAGRRLRFEDDGQLECDVDALFQREEEDTWPQLLVRTVTHLNADNAANSDLPCAKQIAVNNTYLCYALKSGDLRIINRITNGRALVKSHEGDITCVQFLGDDSNKLLIASMDCKISLIEVWDKEEELGFRSIMCATIDLEGPIRVAWGPNNDEIFVFSVQTWVVFVQWTKATQGKEGDVQIEIKCGEGIMSWARCLRFEADVTFLRCRDNALIVATADGMLQIWNSTTAALGNLFSEIDPEIVNPIIKLEVTNDIPVCHVEIFGDDVFNEGANGNAFTFLTVSYQFQTSPGTIIIRSWKCVRSEGSPEYRPFPTQLLSLTVAAGDEFVSLSVDYCRRENLLIIAERHWTSMLAIRCVMDEDLRFECMTKFPLVQEIVSMQLSESPNQEGAVENGIDVFCIQPTIVQQYILDPGLCLPEIREEAEVMEPPVESAMTENHTTTRMPSIEATENAAFFSSVIAAPTTVVSVHPLGPGIATSIETPKPDALPIPMPDSDPELNIPRPPPTLQPAIDEQRQFVSTVAEPQIPAVAQTVHTPKNSAPDTPISDGRLASTGGLSTDGSIHSRSRSDRPELGQLGLDNPEPPSSVSQKVTVAAMHLLSVSQPDRAADPRLDKSDFDTDDPALTNSARMDNELHHLPSMSLVDSGALPLNPDLSDLVETLERSVSNLKRMIQVLEHKLGRAFHSVNKRLDVNFQDTMTRLDNLQNPGGRSGHEDMDMRMREHATVAMQGMLDVVQSTIQTEIKNTLRAVVGGAIQRVFSELWSRQLSGLLNRSVENAISISLSSAVSQGLQSSFRESFSDSIVPAFESAVQNMFGQIQNAFSACLSEHLAENGPMMAPQANTLLQNGITKIADFGETALGDISVLKTAVGTLTNEVHSMKQDIQSLMTASNSQQLSTPGGLPSMARATPDVVISEIFTLLKDEDYESAFNKALSLSRIDVLNRIINFVDYSVLFASEPCPLSQSVLLSLLNQIGCDLVTDTETKLEWIKGAVTHLDSTPASPRVGNLTMGILDYLISKTQNMIRIGQISGPCAVSAKMTLNMLIGARNMNTVS